jgi:hypothetical protein
MLIFIAAGVPLAVAPAFAHHAFAAEYDAAKPIRLKGRLTKMEWVNPHGWLHIDVKDEKGNVVNWAVEFGAPAALLKQGLRKTDFPEGIEVEVTGFLAKNGSASINGSTVKLPDGRNLFTGSSADGAPPPIKDKQ